MSKYINSVLFTMFSAGVIYSANSVAHLTVQDERAFSADMSVVSVHGASGFDFGVSYQALRRVPLELTGSVAKIDGLDYRSGNRAFKHNYGHITAGIKYNYHLVQGVSVSPEVGLTYSMLNHIGATTEKADKGWYYGAELEYRVNPNLSFLVSAQSHQKVFALEDEVLWGVGFRYTPFPSHKSSTPPNRKVRNLFSQENPNRQESPVVQIAKAEQLSSSFDETPAAAEVVVKKPTLILGRATRIEEPQLVANVDTKVSDNVPSGYIKKQIGAFKVRSSIEAFMLKHELQQQDVYVNEVNGLYKLYLVDQSSALASFKPTTNTKPTQGVEYLESMKNDNYLEVALNR